MKIKLGIVFLLFSIFLIYVFADPIGDLLYSIPYKLFGANKCELVTSVSDDNEKAFDPLSNLTSERATHYSQPVYGSVSITKDDESVELGYKYASFYSIDEKKYYYKFTNISVESPICIISEFLTKIGGYSHLYLAPGETQYLIFSDPLGPTYTREYESFDAYSGGFWWRGRKIGSSAFIYVHEPQ